ncbi:MAG: DNA-3-methyladenine glycosylase family protein [Gemmatimonadales bacterium]
MAGLCGRYGPVRLKPCRYFPALVESIVSQQLSTRAADTIIARLRERTRFTPAAMARVHPRRLRAAGLSRAKAGFLRELARFADQGGLRGIRRLPDERVIERLTEVKGIGVWTAEMFLIFALQRPDVWPVGDGGIQRAARELYGVDSREALSALGERFRPTRSHAAWYLWRSLEKE